MLYSLVLLTFLPVCICFLTIKKLCQRLQWDLIQSRNCVFSIGSMYLKRHYSADNIQYIKKYVLCIAASLLSFSSDVNWKNKFKALVISRLNCRAMYLTEACSFASHWTNLPSVVFIMLAHRNKMSTATGQREWNRVFRPLCWTWNISITLHSYPVHELFTSSKKSITQKTILIVHIRLSSRNISNFISNFYY